jgi:predicted transposase YdaD
MLQLTPLEETRAVKELIAMGEKRGERRGEKRGEKRGERRGEERGKRLGEKRGEIIGSIRMCQRFLGIPISTSAELAGKSLRQLAAQRKALLARVDGIRLGNA